MAKKGSDLKKIFGLVACATLVVALVMFLLPVIKYHTETTALGVTTTNDFKFGGLVAAFGGKNLKWTTVIGSTTTETTVDAVKGSWAGIVAFILVVLALAALVGTMVEKKLASKLTLVSAALAIVAGVLVLVALKGAVLGANTSDGVILGNVLLKAENFKLSFAGVMSGILLIVSGGCNVLTLVNLK